MRIALGVEYNGSQYHGWQNQPGLNTVQAYLEKALSTVAAHEVKVTCAGRTDTGVHATNQIIHFDTINQRHPKSWIHGANRYLPQDISVRWVKEVSDDF
ncbi:MAG: tRNA pseudouridine synthase A, partial [Gammaproteobacteria bacterium]